MIGTTVTIEYDNEQVSATLLGNEAAAKWAGVMLSGLMMSKGIGPQTRITVRISN